jgi:hypothetical protein
MLSAGSAHFCFYFSSVADALKKRRKEEEKRNKIQNAGLSIPSSNSASICP